MSIENPDNLTCTADLKSIRLTHAEMGTTVRAPQEAGPVDVMLAKEVAAELVEDGCDEFVVRLEFAVSVIPEARDGDEAGEGAAEPPDPVVWINPAFELRYELSPGTSRPTEAALRLFADATATFNAWPYLREFVQAMLGRMDLPRMTLPLLRRRPAPAQPEELDQGSRAQGSK